MPTTIKLKNSVTTTNAPSSLAQGEVAINITDKKVWVGNAATTPVQLLGDGGSSSFTSIAFGAGTVSNPSITFIGDTNTGIYSPAADTIAFTEGGVESMRITSAGFVGIGTSNPGFNLQVIGALAASTTTTESQIHISNNLSDIYFYNSFAANSFGAFDGTSSQQLFIYSRANNSWQFYTASAERMRITNAGDVGIGNSTPVRKLDVSGSQRLNTGSAGTFLEILGGSGDATYISQEASSELRLNQSNSNSNSKITLLTQGTERMRIDSSGNVGIGVTNPSYKLQVNGAAFFQATGSEGGEIQLANTGGAPGAILDVDSGNNLRVINASNTFTLFSTNSTERMRLTSSDLLVGTTSASGSISNNLGMVTGRAMTAFGQFISPAGTVWNDVFTVTNPGLYILHAYIPGYNSGPSDWSNAWMVSYTGGATAFVGTSMLGATGNIQARIKPGAATTVQVLSSAGTGITYQWVVLRVS